MDVEEEVADGFGLNRGQEVVVVGLGFGGETDGPPIIESGGGLELVAIAVADGQMDFELGGAGDEGEVRTVFAENGGFELLVKVVARLGGLIEG